MKQCPNFPPSRTCVLSGQCPLQGGNAVAADLNRILCWSRGPSNVLEHGVAELHGGTSSSGDANANFQVAVASAEIDYK
jgi:hypothetical protein